MMPQATSDARISFTSVTIASACAEVENPYGVVEVAAVVVTAACEELALIPTGRVPDSGPYWTEVSTLGVLVLLIVVLLRCMGVANHPRNCY
jgi:hypothetical protein